MDFFRKLVLGVTFPGFYFYLYTHCADHCTFKYSNTQNFLVFSKKLHQKRNWASWSNKYMERHWIQRILRGEIQNSIHTNVVHILFCGLTPGRISFFICICSYKVHRYIKYLGKCVICIKYLIKVFIYSRTRSWKLWTVLWPFELS